jgi:hypothetical protein
MNARQRPLESVRVLLVADARRLVTMVADSGVRADWLAAEHPHQLTG